MIKVLVRSATDGGRLFPNYDEESGILSATSNVRRVWTAGADIDGNIRSTSMKMECWQIST